jgi:hypothetical protein
MPCCGLNNADDLYYAHVSADFLTYDATMGVVAINIKNTNTMVQGCCAGGSIQGYDIRQLLVGRDVLNGYPALGDDLAEVVVLHRNVPSLWPHFW